MKVFMIGLIIVFIFQIEAFTEMDVAFSPRITTSVKSNLSHHTQPGSTVHNLNISTIQDHDDSNDLAEEGSTSDGALSCKSDMLLLELPSLV